MKINVVENGNSKEVMFQGSIDVHGLLESLGRYPDGHIVIRDDLPIPLTENLLDGDRIRIIQVASGG